MAGEEVDVTASENKKGGINLSIELLSSDGEIFEALQKSMKESLQLAPCDIIIDAPYAKYVEFGSHPHKEGASPSYDEFGRKAEDRIKIWVNQRFRMYPKTKRDQLSYLIYRHISKNGTPPYPFIQPSLEEMQRNTTLNYFRQADNNSIHSLAERSAALMRDKLRSENHIHTYALIDGIYVRYRSDGEIRKNSTSIDLLEDGTTPEEMTRRLKEAVDNES